MNNQNISDVIEAYLKQILAEQEQIEIRRAEMASQFNCVPSQINYVIKTRFTIPKGYIVESKRGGGGYIRIIKVTLSTGSEILLELEKMIGNRLSEQDALSLLQQLYDNEIITKREGNLFLSLISKQVLQSTNEKNEQELRARLFKALLTRLGYEEKE